MRFSKLLLNVKLEVNTFNLVTITNFHLETAISQMNKFIETQQRFAALLCELNLFCRMKHEKFSRMTISRKKARTLAKLTSSLCRPHNAVPDSNSTSRRIHILSGTVFTKPQPDVLSLGLSFKIPQKKVNEIQTIVEFENPFDKFKDLLATSADDTGWLRAKMVDISHTFLSAPTDNKLGSKQNTIKPFKNFGRCPN
ncbi:unnamed protein product [Echinostoma caproni]|uniref:Uncharacterized protein n=1 Tax=Echinostoma caproni TaxID=27848 RepID=A0A183A2T3_9TREM|nr:unnamed protein product [Echinostoma caproni]